MHVTLDGADDDFRLFLEGTSIDGLHELGFKDLEPGLEGVGREQNFRQEHFHDLELVAENLQRVAHRIDRVHGRDAFLDDLFRRGYGSVFIKIQNGVFQFFNASHVCHRSNLQKCGY